MDIRDWQLISGLAIILGDISFRFYKLRMKKCVVIKMYSMKNIIGTVELGYLHYPAGFFWL